MKIAIEKQALAGESCCGDDAGWWESDGRITLCLADGLGHGREAEAAARAALAYVGGHLAAPLDQLFAGCDEALRGTRGVAMAMAVIDFDPGRLAFAGIGNVRAMVVGPTTVRMASDFGIVGAGYRRLRLETMHLETGSLVVLASDGLSERMDLTGTPPDLRQDPRRLARNLLAEWSVKSPDDAAVLVYLHGPRGA